MNETDVRYRMKQLEVQLKGIEGFDKPECKQRARLERRIEKLKNQLISSPDLHRIVVKDI